MCGYYAYIPVYRMGKMAQSAFYRRTNTHTKTSICLKCFLTVRRTPSLPTLDEAESAHVCVSQIEQLGKWIFALISDCAKRTYQDLIFFGTPVTPLSRTTPKLNLSSQRFTSLACSSEHRWRPSALVSSEPNLPTATVAKHRKQMESKPSPRLLGRCLNAIWSICNPQRNLLD